MAKTSYDLIIVGGGMGGSVLVKVMAEHGVRVLVLEREKQFKDRVRGEGMHAWGVPEAKALGIYELLRNTCGLEVRWWDIYLGSQLMMHRDFLTTTPHQSPLFGFYHPDMQEVLLTAAAEAGAEVWRGASVRAVRSGALPTVTVEQDGWMSELQARLVVAADGRSSLTRQWAGFAVQHDPERRLFAGVLLENVPLAPDTWYAVLNPANGQEVFLGNVGRSWVRAYLGYPKDAHRRFQTTADVPRLIEESLRTGAVADLYAHARAVGPLATFFSQREEIENAQIQESKPDIGLFARRISSQGAQDMRGGVSITKASRPIPCATARASARWRNSSALGRPAKSPVAAWTAVPRSRCNQRLTRATAS